LIWSSAWKCSSTFPILCKASIKSPNS